ncbi:carbohydrate sulfotransferase 13-like [Haliotis rubra]|uniref:carbohydrate sulfotransferase 13-like n=1 Tax=Haliotis rubra TaxID=36100 RepID=UPI001EE5DFA2|nr:carbohydrate sulfotransferase 13-like [Haliotis rubra]
MFPLRMRRGRRLQRLTQLVIFLGFISSMSVVYVAMTTNNKARWVHGGHKDSRQLLEDHGTSRYRTDRLEPENMAALERRFDLRRKIYDTTCSKTGTLNHGVVMPTHDRKDGRKTYIQHNVTMCFVEKAGSMFWSRYFNAFEQSIVGNHRTSVETHQLSQKEYDKTVKIVFVRNPYSRLLSGYVDKIFSTNPDYMRIMGRHIIQDIRFKGQKRANIQCGVDATFAEFVDYILYQHEHNQSINNHFRPAHHRCAFCHMKYDYIGKMETFLEDMMFVSRRIGALKHNRTRDLIQKEGFHGIEEMMYRNSHNIFTSRLERILACGVTLRQALKLTWRRWQIRGFLGTQFDFPFRDADSDINWERFLEYAVRARRASDPKTLSKAKRAALREAYSTLTLQTKLKLKRMFEPQFEMFGYEAMPESIFGSFDQSETDFRFFDVRDIFDIQL